VAVSLDGLFALDCHLGLDREGFGAAFGSESVASDHSEINAFAVTIVGNHFGSRDAHGNELVGLTRLALALLKGIVFHGKQACHCST